MRRAPLTSLIQPGLIALILLAPTGCSQWMLRSKLDTQSLDEATLDEANLIGGYTHPYGLNYVQVDAVALVTGLDGTGSDPSPSPQRAALLNEMKRHKVPNPNAMLASESTALVTLRGFLRPGIRKGDKFDIQVRVPSRSDTTSLRNGWVLPAKLTEHALLGRQVRQGHTLAEAVGPVLVDPGAAEEEALANRGRILSGGIALRDRPMGLIVSHPSKSVRLSKEISSAINERFDTYQNGRKTGLANPKTDEFIELLLHPRYKDNVTRFVKVVRSIAIREDSEGRQKRQGRLAMQLMDPLTTANAALRLEALGGEQAVETLKQGSRSSDPEVRFYSAEALAYLDETAAVKPLADAAREEPAFRVHALAALSAMDDISAYEALRELLAVRSAETRYGAFRSLWSMNSGDPLVRGELLGEQFSYHVLDVEGPPMLHVTRSFRPEIVLFGVEQEFQLPMVVNGGKRIIVNGLTGNQVTVSRFSEGGETQKRVVSPDVDDVIRAIVELGGSYPDVVQALQQARADNALAVSLRVDALPETGRRFASREDRDSDSDEPIDPDDLGATPYRVATPVPDLFSRQKK
ncbi:MAG: flagellar basal body P-ring protein FlgI [Planctomycetota bacterium]